MAGLLWNMSWVKFGTTASYEGSVWYCVTATEQTGWSGKTFDLYLGSTRFEYWLEHRIYWLSLCGTSHFLLAHVALISAYLARYLPFVTINNLTTFENTYTTKNKVTTLKLQRQTEKTWNTEKKVSQFPGTIQGEFFFHPEYKFKTLNGATNWGNLGDWRTTN
jgi:hypothetical protein